MNLETNAAPAGSTPPADSSSAPESTALYDIGDIAAALKEPEQKPESEPSPVPDEGDVLSQGAEGEGGELVDLPMPEGWEKAMWDGMTAEARSKVDGLVKAHAEALSAKVREMQDVQKQVQATIAKANADAQRVMDFVREVTQGEFGGMDWNALQADPETFVRVQKAYLERQNAIRQIQEQMAQQAQAIAQAQAAEARQLMQAEFDAALPKVQALVGEGFERKAFGAQLRAYLEGAGVPAEALGMMSRGYELELATKAMLYDKLQSAREAAAAKVASAPAVQAPRGSVQTESGDVRGQRLRALQKNPRSTDAIAALLKEW